MNVADGGVEPPSLLPRLCAIGRCSAVELITRVSPADFRTYGLCFIVVYIVLQLADAVLTTLPLLASLPHQFVVQR